MLFKKKKFIYKHFGIFLAFTFIFFCFLISIFSYFIIPDESQYSNQMHLSIHSMQPGFKTYILEIPNSSNFNESYLNTKFFGKKFPNKEIVIKKYDFLEEGIQYENYSQEKLFVNYGVKS